MRRKILMTLIASTVLVALTSCAQQAPEPAAPDTAAEVQATVDYLSGMPLVVSASGATETLAAYNSPLQKLEKPEVGFSGSYEVSGVAGVRVLVKSPLPARFDASSVTAVGTGLTDVEFLRVIRAARDGAGFREVAGIVPLATVAPSVNQVASQGRDYGAPDCLVVAQDVDSLLAAKSGALNSKLAVVYLDPESFKATYVGMLDKVVD